MKIRVTAVAALVVAAFAWPAWPAEAEPAPAADKPAEGPAAGKIRTVVVTGGHGFEEKPFLAVFEAMPHVAFSHAPQKDHSELFEDISQWQYDVIVLYNMSQKISEARRKNFVSLLERGVGLVVLHHALAAFQEWPEFKTIVGGKFYLADTQEGDTMRPKSTYQHGLDLKIHVADPNHPITKGVTDFTIHDEAYAGLYVDPKVHVLLTCEHPACNKAIGWAGAYGKARTCYLLLGHDPKAYASKEFQTLVHQAIRWAAGR